MPEKILRGLFFGLWGGVALIFCLLGLQISYLLVETGETLGYMEADLTQTNRELRQAIFDLRGEAKSLTALGSYSLGLAVKEISRTEDLFNERTDSLLQLVHRHAEDVQGVLVLAIRHFDEEHLTPAQQNMNTVATQTLETEQRIGDFVQESRDLVFDCQGNPGCLENRIMNVSYAAQRMSESAANMAQSAEKNAASIERITKNIEVTTEAVRKAVEPKKGFWNHLWHGVLLVSKVGVSVIF